MNIIRALNWRYAARQFSSDLIAEERIQELLTATRLSATSYGLQPYRMIMVNNIKIRRALFEYAMGQEKVVNCSHLLVLAVQTDLGVEMVDRYIQLVAETRDIPVEDLQGFADHIKHVFTEMNPEQKQIWAHQQAYIALGTLLTTAAIMKIDTCPMTGFEPDGFDQVLSLNELGLESSVICALGMRHPEDNNAELTKVRYDQSEMVITV